MYASKRGFSALFEDATEGDYDDGGDDNATSAQVPCIFLGFPCLGYPHGLLT